MTAPEKDNGRGAAAEVKSEKQDDAIIAEALDTIKCIVMTGSSVAPSDFPAEQRPAFWAAIKIARDDLPNLKPAWRTLEEHHVNGVRVRERIYRLRGGV